MASEIESLLPAINFLWPQFKITKENLSSPKYEMVFKIYSAFISEFQEKISSLIGSEILDVNTEHLEPEERLFLKMSSIFCEKNNFLKFMPGDIYEPTPARTKFFFGICVHFYGFTEQLFSEVEKLGGDIMKIKKDTSMLLKEREEILTEINKYATEKAQLLEDIDTSTEKLKTVKVSFEELKDLQSNKARGYTEKKKQIESMKRELQKEQYDLKRLEAEEKCLREQTVVEEEYKNILQTISDLENQQKGLGNDDIDMEGLLTHENNVLQHIQNCVKSLPYPPEFNIDNINELIKQEENLEDLKRIIEKMCTVKLNPLKQTKMQNEKKIEELNKDWIKLQEQYEQLKQDNLSDIEKLSLKLSTLKEEISENCKNCNNIILKFKKEILKLENTQKNIRNKFKEEYIKVAKAEKSAMEKLYSTLQKLELLK